MVGSDSELCQSWPWAKFSIRIMRNGLGIPIYYVLHDVLVTYVSRDPVLCLCYNSQLYYLAAQTSKYRPIYGSLFLRVQLSLITTQSTTQVHITLSRARAASHYALASDGNARDQRQWTSTTP